MIHGYNEVELELIGDSYYLFETGEYVGDKLPAEFTVHDDSSLEWVLERIMDYEGAQKAIDAKYEAILERYNREKKKASSRTEWLKARFLPEVEAYAKTKLDGKSKYVETPFGRVSFRTVKGGLRVFDKDQALEFAKGCGYVNAIKTTEEFQISKLTDDQKSEIIERSDIPGFQIVPDTETCSISTGVK